METSGSSSSVSRREDDKPVVVRVKRKSMHSPLDVFCLEINERPLKRPLLDFGHLSISGSSGKVEELRNKRVLVKHVGTRGSSESTFPLLQSLTSTSSKVSESKTGNEERGSLKRKNPMQEELLSKARDAAEVLSKNARFEQIWRSRRGKNLMEEDTALHEMYHLYDVVRIDEDEKSRQVPEEETVSLEDQKMLSSYLPMLRELIPNAAAEVESDLSARASRRGAADDYVYDYYVMQADVDMTHQDAFNVLPLVQVDDEEDFYDGPDSEYGSDDSNAENNPMNDYPDEISTDEELESEQSKSGEEEGDEEEDDASNSSSGEEVEPLFEDEDGMDVNGDGFDYASGDSDTDDL